MNDNQEKNSQNEEQNAPLVKKAAKFSAFLYLALAIVVVIVATVGIFNVSYDYEESLPPISFPEVSLDNNLLLPESKPESDAPVVNEPSDVPVDIEEVKFYAPVSGEIIKQHDLERLVFSQTMGDYRVHKGIDIKSELGTNVLCFTDGVVSSVKEDYFFGTSVEITHENGLVSYYMNLDPTLNEGISVGSELKAGQPFAKVGSSARCEAADEAHLHFELRVNGTLIDPENELPRD